MLRWMTAGESHGRALVAVVEAWSPAWGHFHRIAAAAGPPAARLRPGRADDVRAGRGHRAPGVRHGITLGGPIAIGIGNTEWPKWETVMAPDPVDAGGAGRRAATPR